MEKGISIVICCYNSEQKIPKVLNCLQNQKINAPLDWEVLVIDNASTDNTAAIAKECWGMTDVKLRVVNEPNPGISNARRKGFEDARFEIISFVDDDNWVEDEWLQKVFDTMYSDIEIGILGGLGMATFDKDSPAWFSRFQSSYAVGPQGNESGEIQTNLYGAGMNIRKDTWNTLKENGFEFQLTGRRGKQLSSGEDFELSQAVLLSGKKLYYRSDLTFYHYMPPGRLTWQYLVKLSGAFGRSEPISGIYRSLLRGDEGFNARKYQNRFFSLLRTGFDLLKFSPRALRLIFVRREGQIDHIFLVYLWNSLKEKIALYKSFHSIVNEIRSGAWNKQTHPD